MQLPIDRIKNIILSPKTEWPVIAAETTTPKELYLNYIVLLAAIPAVAGFIGMTVFGLSIMGFTVKMGLGAGLAQAILRYLMSLGMVWVLALIVDALAPKFGSEKNFNQSLKLVAYAMTPAWVAGIFALLPALSILSLIAAIYALYVLYLGFGPMKSPPLEKQGTYYIITLLCAIVASVVIGIVVGALTPAAAMPTVSTTGNPRLEEMGNKWMETAEKARQAVDKQIEEANKPK